MQQQNIKIKHPAAHPPKHPSKRHFSSSTALRPFGMSTPQASPETSAMKWADIPHEEDAFHKPDWGDHAPIDDFTLEEGPNAAQAAWEEEQHETSSASGPPAAAPVASTFWEMKAAAKQSLTAAGSKSEKAKEVEKPVEQLERIESAALAAAPQKKKRKLHQRMSTPRTSLPRKILRWRAKTTMTTTTLRWREKTQSITNSTSGC